MGKRMAMATRLNQTSELKIPSFFQCPISLELMQSPVSLCTGVTYDRSSISQWLDSGHTTCPATMLPLPSTDLVPNLTLRRLIHHWSTSAAAPHADYIGVLGSSNPMPGLLYIIDCMCNTHLDSTVKNNIVSSASTAVATVVGKCSVEEVVEAAVRALAVILRMDCIEESNKMMVVADLRGCVLCISNALKNGSDVGSRIDAARVIDAMFSLSDTETKMAIAETSAIADDLIRLVGNGGEAVEAGVACLVRLSQAGKKVVLQTVKAGLVPEMLRVLEDEENVNVSAAEGALRLMETAMRCAEGRTAVCEVAERCVGAVVGRMMKVGREGQEAAVAVLWGLCCAVKDKQARTAAAGASGGLAKILLLMQGECSPQARRMSGELLRVFRLDPKSRLAAYDTKTTHIMPF